MTSDAQFEDINETKANMDHIYNQLDPRDYFRELKEFDYSIPDAAKPIFQKLINHLRKRRGDTIHILDLGCSYGINAALLKYNLSMDDLYDHWGRKKPANSTPEAVTVHDRNFFGDCNESQDIAVIGLDQAENAITFAEKVGLLDQGFAINLETEPLPERANRDLAATDLVISTGCVGYVTEKSFDRLLPVITQGQRPWLANFVLQLFPFDAIEATLNKWGYVTEKLEGHTFVQRQFVSTDEQKQALDRLRDRGIEPTGQEAKNRLLAEFYLSRPAADAAKTPIEDLLSA